MLGGRKGIATIVVERLAAAAGECSPAAETTHEKSPSRSRVRPQYRSTFRLGSCEPRRTTFRCCFVLLPRRARRGRESRCSGTRPQGPRRTKKSEFATLPSSTSPQVAVHAVESRAEA